jgi:hypothetical protein
VEGILLLAALGGGLYWLASKASEHAAAAAERRRLAEAEESAQRGRESAWARQRAAAARKRQQQLRRLNAKARALQLALLGLRSAPDFRRAASWAAHAADVPLAFRQRQFRRFRGAILRHLALRLQAGSDPELLTQSLRQLLTHLGVAPFEADYLREQASRSLAATPSPQQTYAERLRDLQREHDQRRAALERSDTLADEVREQLLEAEETRFREALLGLGDERSGPAP